MDHLDVVTGAGGTHPVTAGVVADLSGSLLEDLLDRVPCSNGTTGHQAGAIAKQVILG